MPSSGWVNIHWKLKQTCTPSCTYGAWGECSGGYQTRTATPVCGGTCDQPTSRQCLKLEGVIWNDLDGDGAPWNDPKESWTGSSVGSPCTPQTHPKFYLEIPGTGKTGNRIKAWWCGFQSSTYYGTARDFLIDPQNYDIKPESIIPSVTLSSLPSG
jgi:hypothetical protein